MARTLLLMAAGILLAAGASGQTEPFKTAGAPVGPDNPRNSEAAIVPLKDGSLLLGWTEFYAGNGADHGPARIPGLVSRDGGRTWTRMKPTPIQGYPPHLIRLNSGKVLTVYGRRIQAFGEYACLSDDQGRTWDVAHEIKLAGNFNGDLGYPASVELPDGSILTVYYQSEKRVRKPV